MIPSASKSPTIISVALPSIVSNLAFSLVAMASIKAVGGLGPDAIAAVLAAERAASALQPVFLVVTAATVTLVAQNWGARRYADATAALKLSLTLVTALAAAMALIVWALAGPLLVIFGLSPELSGQAAAFLRITFVFSFAFGGAQVMSAALRASGDAYTPFLVFLGANVVNVTMLWLLVRGSAGAPALGVPGAAVANGLAYAFAAAILLIAWRGRRLRIGPEGGRLGDLCGVRQVVRIGVPAAIENGLLHLGLLAMMFFVSHFGADAIAAYGVGLTLVSFSYVFGVGFGVASATMVGQHVGAGDPEGARRAAWRCAAFAVPIMTLLSFVMFAFGRDIARELGLRPEAQEILRSFLLIFVIVSPMMALEFSMSGALRGAGATRSNMIIAMSGLFGGRLLVSTLFFLAGLGVNWLFTALIADYAIKSMLYFLKVRSTGWTAPVIPPAPLPAEQAA